MKNLQITVLSVLGLIFLALAVYYWVTPGGSLLHFLPGYMAGETARHTKHALAALVLAAGCGVLVWFMSAKKSETPAGDDSDDTTDESEE